jgi:hypothetical protein
VQSRFIAGRQRHPTQSLFRGLKTARLSRFLKDSVYQTMMEYDDGGYPCDPDSVPPEVFDVALGGEGGCGVNSCLIKLRMARAGSVCAVRYVALTIERLRGSATHAAHRARRCQDDHRH